MRDFIEQGGSTLLLGPDESWAGILALQFVLEELADGAVVVQLADTPQDGDLSRARDWVRELKQPASLLDNFHVLGQFRHFTSAASLAEKIKEIAQGKKVIVYVNMAGNSMATQPNDFWLPIAIELPLHLDNASVVTSLAYGSPFAPAPRLTDFPADKIWLSKPGLHLQFRIVEVKPGASEIKLEGKVHHGGLIAFKEVVEDEHGAR